MPYLPVIVLIWTNVKRAPRALANKRHETVTCLSYLDVL
jgi:hypothetical protein